MRTQQLDELRVVLRRISGKARRVNAGCAAEYVDFEARIVGERQETGLGVRGVRLDARVLFERRARLVDLVFERNNLHAGKQRAKLGDLSRVVRREDQFHAMSLSRSTPAFERVARCIFASSAMPFIPRSTSASRLARGLGSPSAAP